ncbi:ABC transporter permease [Brevundimonas halotolerans]|jgi:lantibiotic transport system permease protein|uniref:ABC-2 type transport system permease protein n=1 Tax=Brevundimonas halotolerans TaxID=69670 RepID=A0A7W9A4B1_9CAUL|nr:ABC transporter permease [Brevundimonas halotolerans]MBB5661182.1 ABC-2 type transport system permease protein [Brevundimonas halotolerans]
MLRVLTVELRKLNRSLAAALAIAAPGLIAVFTFFNILRGKTAQPWDMWMVSAAGIWAFFMLPMSVTALTALIAHMEHGPRTWDHLRALPLPRWTLYAAKILSVFLVLAAMSVGVFAFTWAAVKLAVVIKPELAPTGVFDASAYLTALGRMYLAATLVVVIQLWIALRWSSFVPGLVVGIGGTFFAVVATAAKVGVFLPWQMPVNMLATEGWRLQTALGLGFGGGLVLLALMLWHLSRREVL